MGIGISVINLRRSRFIMGSPTLQWRHNERDGFSNHQLHGCLLNRSFRRKSKKTSKLRVTGLCVGNSPVTGEFPAQRASNAENVYIWWRHDDTNKRPRNAIYCRYNTVQYNTLLSYPYSKIDMLGLEEIFTHRKFTYTLPNARATPSNNLFVKHTFIPHRFHDILHILILWR